MRRIPPTLALVATALLATCSDEAPSPTDVGPVPEPLAQERSPAARAIAAMMNDVNVALAAEGMPYRVTYAEYLTDGSDGEMGNTVLAKDLGNKRLGADFVPNDPRRTWSGPDNTLTYAIDTTGDADPAGPAGMADATAAVIAGMDTWDAMACSDLGLTRAPDFGVDIGVAAFIFGLGGSPFIFADVQHGGWGDIDFAGGVLGVAYSFAFTDLEGNFTDIDGNGLDDKAFADIYYDNSFDWNTDGSTNIDVQSVATHEAGHGLAQAHFGKVWLKNDGSIKSSPHAIMNAAYTGPFQDPHGTDTGGHCAIWGDWPQN